MISIKSETKYDLSVALDYNPISFVLDFLRRHQHVSTVGCVVRSISACRHQPNLAITHNYGEPFVPSIFRNQHRLDVCTIVHCIHWYEIANCIFVFNSTFIYCHRIYPDEWSPRIHEKNEIKSEIMMPKSACYLQFFARAFYAKALRPSALANFQSSLKSFERSDIPLGSPTFDGP